MSAVETARPRAASPEPAGTSSETTGNALLAQALADAGLTHYFFVLGGPMMGADNGIAQKGIRMIDVRHEQAAAMMAHAFSRVTGTVGVASGCSGPGALNLLTGIGHAWADGVPVVALGGASPAFQNGMGAFQEVDQLECFRPVTKWCYRVTHPGRIPDVIDEAFRRARTGRPGPVYIDLPADVLYGTVELKDDARFGQVRPRRVTPPRIHRPLADPADVAAAADLLAAAERPIVLAGSGVNWSEAHAELRELVELAGIPFYTTPQSRGMIPEDHPLALIAARSAAFRDADVVLVVGTRLNYVVSFAHSPRFNHDAKLIQVDIDPTEFGHNREVDVALQGDVRAVLTQLVAECRSRFGGRSRSAWVQTLTAVHEKKTAEHEAAISTGEKPIHPLRLAKEVRDVIRRDDILVVDGSVILTAGRQTIPSYLPNHRFNSGVWGTMGVGLPFGIGAKLAAPDKRVLVLHGDGSFGMNGMEIDTAVRHSIPIVCVISNNGAWGGGAPADAGRMLGHVRYDRMAEGLGAYSEYVEDPEEIGPAIERAFASGRPAVVNVIVAPQATTGPQMGFTQFQAI
jgi:thiamine pyrophosphate-dependent acetolactate synthase large subunit-like protein